MPETTTNYSIDKLVYNCLNKFSKDNCYLTPNHITIFNIFITFLILYFFYNRGSMSIILILIFIRCILDILDGCVARMCNKGSKLGHKLDTIGDILARTLLLMLMLYTLVIEGKNNNKGNILQNICTNWNNHNTQMKVVIVVITFLVFYHFYLFYVFLFDKPFEDITWLSDHTIIVGLLVGYITRKYIIT